MELHIALLRRDKVCTTCHCPKSRCTIPTGFCIFSMCFRVYLFFVACIYVWLSLSFFLLFSIIIFRMPFLLFALKNTECLRGVFDSVDNCTGRNAGQKNRLFFFGKMLNIWQFRICSTGVQINLGFFCGGYYLSLDHFQWHKAFWREECLFFPYFRRAMISKKFF